MNLPRLRFTVRQMMVAVAIVAGIFGTERLMRHQAEYANRAEYHERMLGALALIRREGCYPYCSMGVIGIPWRYDAKTAPLHARCVAYHSLMMHKYRRAASLPWLAVALDPPPPYPALSYFDYELRTR